MSFIEHKESGRLDPSHPDHVHDCTGPDMTCPCGFRFVVAPIFVSIEIGDGPEYLISEAFNCNDIDVAIGALRRAIKTLESWPIVTDAERAERDRAKQDSLKQLRDGLSARDAR